LALGENCIQGFDGKTLRKLDGLKEAGSKSWYGFIWLRKGKSGDLLRTQ
jgi:hypothetical protein